LKAYAVTEVSERTLELFNKIRRIFKGLPEIELEADDGEGEKPVSCHMIVRALAEIFSLDYKDGYFGPGFEHSWLVPERGVIIDVYPVALVGGSILVVTRYATPWSYLYQEEKIERIDNLKFLEDTDKVKEVIEETMKKLEI
jgi:hypothetical protein